MSLRAPHFLALALGLAFLYLPILTLIAYSFNGSRLVAVWGGFSTKWYGELWRDAALRDAALLSLQVGVIAASLATALGALAGVALARFRATALLSGLVLAPLVMPDTVIGLALLLLCVALSVEPGFATLVLAHVTLGLPYVALIVQSRLTGFDRRLEEAAQDLGAPPWRVFSTITLPLIAPAIAAGWMLAFALSLDDLVIASFTTGPGATTLPMRIYSAVRLGVSPEINAACSVMVGVAAAMVALAGWVSRGEE